MRKPCTCLALSFLVALGVAPIASDGPAAAGRRAGLVMSVDRSAGTIVLGDMGPRLPSGESKVTPQAIRVTPSTQFVRVRRAEDIAPSGWRGDYVESRLPAWEVKPGDWVTATVEDEGARPTAVKVMVVDTTGP
jgi:hypothetical protein